MRKPHDHLTCGARRVRPVLAVGGNLLDKISGSQPGLPLLACEPGNPHESFDDGAFEFAEAQGGQPGQPECGHGPSAEGAALISSPRRAALAGAPAQAVWPVRRSPRATGATSSPRISKVGISGESRCMARASFLAWRWLLRLPRGHHGASPPASAVPSASTVPPAISASTVSMAVPPHLPQGPSTASMVLATSVFLPGWQSPAPAGPRLCHRRVVHRTAARSRGVSGHLKQACHCGRRTCEAERVRPVLVVGEIKLITNFIFTTQCFGFSLRAKSPNMRDSLDDEAFGFAEAQGDQLTPTADTRRAQPGVRGSLKPDTEQNMVRI